MGNISHAIFIFGTSMRTFAISMNFRLFLYIKADHTLYVCVIVFFLYNIFPIKFCFFSFIAHTIMYNGYRLWIKMLLRDIFILSTFDIDEHI